MSGATSQQAVSLIRDSIQQDTGAKSRLLDLPPELRNPIYSYLLESPHEFCFRHIVYDEKTKRVRKWDSCHPNILSTCRLIHKEATPILYGANKFMITGNEPKLFDTHAHGTLVALVRYVKIQGCYDMNLYATLDNLQPAVGLETLEIEYDGDPEETEEEFAFMDFEDGETGEENFLEDQAMIILSWVKAEHTRRQPLGKPDPLDVLKISYEYGAKDNPLAKIAEKLAWKLEYGEESRGYEREVKGADEALKKELEAVNERAKKLEAKLHDMSGLSDKW